MMRMLLLLLLLCSSCANYSPRGQYEAMQNSRRNECLMEPTPRYMQECLARTRMPYEEYERLLNEAVVAAEAP